MTSKDRTSKKVPEGLVEMDFPPERESWPVADRDFGQGLPFERWKKRDLYERAKEIGIEGRSQMTKAELISSLRSRLHLH